MAERAKFRVIEGGGQRTGPSLNESLTVGRQTVGRLVSGGTALGSSLLDVHHRIIGELGFRFVRKTSEGTLPGGFQLFYLKDNVLVRIKTAGTAIRPRPHMTISLVNDALDWDAERAKFSDDGNLTAKTLVGAGSGSSTPMRLIQCNPPLTRDVQDTWAGRSHFDFAPGFDDSAAGVL